MKMKQGIFLLGILVASQASAKEISIATLDMQRALQAVESGKSARAQLETEFNKKKEELQTEEAAIKKMTDAFKKQSLAMSDKARNKKQMELQERIGKFQENTARSQVEIQQKERDLTGPIITKLRSVIQGIAKKKGYTLVLEKSENTVLYSLDKDDLTQEVITAFDKEMK